jgi:hypothetical protein
MPYDPVRANAQQVNRESITTFSSHSTGVEGRALRDRGTRKGDFTISRVRVSWEAASRYPSLSKMQMKGRRL